MIRSAENSLRSLKVDVIDVLQLHGVSTEDEVTDERAREALRKLIDQGKVRAAGVTTHSGQETVLRAVANQGFYKTVLVAYNFRSDTGVAATVAGALGLSQGLSNTIRSVAESGIGVIAMKTQAGDTRRPGGIQPAPGGARLGPRQPRRGHDDPGDDELRPGRGEPGGARQTVHARRPGRSRQVRARDRGSSLRPVRRVRRRLPPRRRGPERAAGADVPRGVPGGGSRALRRTVPFPRAGTPPPAGIARRASSRAGCGCRWGGWREGPTRGLPDEGGLPCGAAALRDRRSPCRRGGSPASRPRTPSRRRGNGESSSPRGPSAPTTSTRRSTGKPSCFSRTGWSA